MALIVISIVLLGCFSTRAPANGPVKIMPLGDSITRGVGSTNYNGYRKPLYLNLTASGYNVDFVGSQIDGDFSDPDHEGHGTWHAEQDGTVYDINDQVYGWLVTYQADIILLHIGTNDITAGEQDANEVSNILDEIDRFSTDIKVILALIIDRQTHSPVTTQFNIDVNTMAQNRIAGGDDIIIVDMEHTLNYTTDMSDNLHPNDSGYVKMASVWYSALTDILVRQMTLTCSSTKGGSVTQPGEGVFDYNEGSIVDISAEADVNYFFANWMGTAVDAGKVADANSNNTTVIVDGNYTLIANFDTNKGNRLEEINQRLELRTDGDINDFTAFYTANGWSLDTTEEFEVKVDFHYSDTNSIGEGWVGISIEKAEEDYVSLSAGFDGNEAYYYYEKSVDGDVVYEQSSRTSSDGALYISYDAGLDELYISTTGYGFSNAWQIITGLLVGQWSSEPVSVAIGGGCLGAALSVGEAYLDNFEVTTGQLLGWPPVTDIDGNGFIEWNDLKIMCDYWLETGPDILGDICKDENDIVNFLDFAEFGLAW